MTLLAIALAAAPAGGSTISLLTVAITALLSGGLVTALVSIYTARKKVPAERDSIAVSGAETAVMSLERSLEAETRRADRAEAKVIKQDERISVLESKLDELQIALDGARAELYSILSEAKRK
jgi:hypothetical protein